MDDIGAAERDVGPFDQIGEIALVQSRPQVIAQCHHAVIGQGGADPHPVDFLRRLDLAQPRIAPVEIRDRAEFFRKHRVLLKGHRADDANLAGARYTLLQYRNGRGNRRAATPGDFRPGGNPPRHRRMVDVLHEHRVRLAGGEHTDGLRGHRPAGQPLHRGAETVGATEYEIVEAGFAEQILDGAPPPRHFRVGKARVFGLHNGLQARG
jgi:hypothetical protein